MKKLVDVYPYYYSDTERLFLIFRRSKSSLYAGQWRIIGGKCEKDENRSESALRELTEETGIYPNKLWVIPSINQFYEPETDQIHHIPAFAAEMPFQQIVLNHEHDTFLWLPAQEAANKLLWPEQKRLLLLTDAILSSNSVLPEWDIRLHSE